MGLTQGSEEEGGGGENAVEREGKLIPAVFS